MSLKSPECRLKITKGLLMLEGWYNPFRVLEELRRGRRTMSVPDGKHGELSLAQEEMSNDLKELILSFVASLKACAKKKDLYEGRRLHAKICRSRLLEKPTYTYMGNMLVSMYAKCGALVEAQQVLDEMPFRNVVSWSTLIAGYVQMGQGEEALDCFEKMQNEGLSPNAITYACFLKACGIAGALDKGKQAHEEIVSQGLFGQDIFLGNALIAMYAKCGALDKAQKVLENLPIRDVVSWSALIAGYTQNGQGDKALACLARMQSERLSPDAITYASLLKACGITKAFDKGKQLHDEIVCQGLLGKDVVLGNVLVDMYVKCSALAKAQEVLDRLPIRDVVSWSTLIVGYVQREQGKDALNCLQRMQREGLTPNAITYACCLKACGITREADTGREIHNQIIDRGLLGKDVTLDSALVYMYAKCGLLSKAQQVLDELPMRNEVSWNALLTGYAERGQCEEALNCFRQMQSEGLSPDAITYILILQACGFTGAVDTGKQIHDEIVRQGMLGRDVVLGTALVDMYAKCGVFSKARQVLNELPNRDVVSWSALIAGYAQQGQGEEALECFQHMQSEGVIPNRVSWNALIGAYAQQGQPEKALKCFQQMQCEGIPPDAITFASVLNACSHSGLVEEGQSHFEDMSRKYNISPDLEHYVCMIDLFGRAGDFNKAMNVITGMPSSDYWPVWSALLAASRKWGDVKLGRMAFEHAIQIDKREAAAYICMSNIYANAGMHEEAQRIEELRVINGAWTQPGCTWWADENGDVHLFADGQQNKEIDMKLREISLKLSQQGYSPSTCLMSQNISHVANSGKRDVLCKHTEKLAIACALINTPHGKDVKIIKNMRACHHCHVVTSLISKIENRKIFVKDTKCLHIFEHGKCACDDYWLLDM